MTTAFANKVFLAATALVFALFGVWGLLDPDGMVSGFGIDLTSGEARTLIRASYGGFLIGASALFAVCAVKAHLLQMGNLAVIILTTPIFLARGFGILIDGGQTGPHMFYLAVEALGIVIAAHLWMRTN